MQRGLATARRYRWLLLAILALVWGAGLWAAYDEYANTYEAQATIWVLRASPELAATNLDDPSVPVIQTVAAQQVELLNQLLQSKSFVRDVVGRTSLSSTLEASPNDTKVLDDVRERFRIRTLGTSMLRVSFTASEPRLAVEMVESALAVRLERVTQARLAATAAVSTLYRREFEVAQAQALDAQRQLDQFNATHKPPLSVADEHVQAQLRLALDFAQVRLSDLKGRADRAIVATAVLEMSGIEFQVVDEPRLEMFPSGGARPAAILAIVAIAAGSALAVLMIVVATLLANHVAGPADVGRLAPAKLFATVPRVVTPRGLAEQDLRTSLALIAFGNGNAGNAKERE
ncbi:MAG: hypothetical protein ACRDF9_02470 [Candidatus Limnocylindria bacterium]